MPGIVLMALIVLSAAALVCIALVDLGTRRLLHYGWLMLVGLPLSFLVNTLIKGPIIHMLGTNANVEQILQVGVTPLWFILLLWLTSPIIEEWIKAVPFLVPGMGGFLETPQSSLWAGMALGMGFGLGEGIHLTYQLASSAGYVDGAWYLFNGFGLERFISPFLNGALTAIVVYALQKNGRQGLLGYLTALGLHALVSGGAVLVYIQVIPPLLATIALVLTTLLCLGIFESRRRQSLQPAS